jgi:hypothetical protein
MIRRWNVCMTTEDNGVLVNYADHSAIIKELLDMVEYLGYTKEMGGRIAELRKEYGE